MNFHVGQKVVCVDGSRRPWTHEQMLMPTEGAIYTIRSINDVDDGVAVQLNEIENPECVLDKDRNWVEPSFILDRFRPLIERKKQTDISVFMAILDQPHRGGALAGIMR